MVTRRPSLGESGSQAAGLLNGGAATGRRRRLAMRIMDRRPCRIARPDGPEGHGYAKVDAIARTLAGLALYRAMAALRRSGGAVP